ncbi:hypothetical protein ET445_05470 [Agromyces protaetiae]|uniref:Htaa domain-containing protein n=1 Tax=Agromyces protaetiae TaxID=2509455 RepID=A0A4V0YGY9_9MICO|nr:hypothetical protein ET445_05470 [Agromyces protaetiae]
MIERLAAGAIALGLVLAPAGAAFAADDDGAGAGGLDIVVTVPSASPETGRTITNAQLRWGLNGEAGSGAFAGGCNFLSAGKAGDTGGARVWTAADGFYRASEGSVRVEKPDAAGEWRLASFENRCLDASGAPVSAASFTSTTGNQVVIDGGVGTFDPARGAQIRWTGSFTVVFYGGMTYWSASNPVLSLDAAGNGQLTATGSGYATSMEDMSKWEPIAPRTIVLAELRGASIADGGFAIVPEYLGVTAPPDSGQVVRSTDNAAWWGSFPSSFVQFQKITGQTGYWLTTGVNATARSPRPCCG